MLKKRPRPRQRSLATQRRLPEGHRMWAQSLARSGGWSRPGAPRPRTSWLRLKAEVAKHRVSRLRPPAERRKRVPGSARVASRARPGEHIKAEPPPRIRHSTACTDNSFDRHSKRRRAFALHARQSVAATAPKTTVMHQVCQAAAGRLTARTIAKRIIAPIKAQTMLPRLNPVTPA